MKNQKQISQLMKLANLLHLYFVLKKLNEGEGFWYEQYLRKFSDFLMNDLLSDEIVFDLSGAPTTPKKNAKEILKQMFGKNYAEIIRMSTFYQVALMTLHAGDLEAMVAMAYNIYQIMGSDETPIPVDDYVATFGHQPERTIEVDGTSRALISANLYMNDLVLSEETIARLKEYAQIVLA